MLIQHAGAFLAGSGSAACTPPGSPFAATSCNCSDHHGHRHPPNAHASAGLSGGAPQVGVAGTAGRICRASTCHQSGLTNPPRHNRLPRAVTPAGASPPTSRWNSCSIQVTRGCWPKGPLNHPTAGDLEGLPIDLS